MTIPIGYKEGQYRVQTLDRNLEDLVLAHSATGWTWPMPMLFEEEFHEVNDHDWGN